MHLSKQFNGFVAVKDNSHRINNMKRIIESCGDCEHAQLEF